MRKLVFGLAAVAALVATPLRADDYNAKLDIGQKAPDFSALPAAEGSSDTSVSLSDLKEDVVVVVFLANHCPMVGNYDDRIIDLVESYKGKPVKLVGICVSQMEEDKLPAIKQYIADKGLNYVYAYDESQEVGRAYNATVTPEFFVLDKERTIRYMGALDDNADETKAKTNYVKQAIDALLAGKEIETTSAKPRGCGIGYASKK